MKLLAIDGNSILNRAFYGIKLLTTKEGMPTNGIYGFLTILLRLLQDIAPDGVAVCFDLAAPTFRHRQYEGYKALRKGMPDDLARQVQPLKELLTALGYVVVEQEGYEADDLLGTLSKACEQSGATCVIATGDRDSFQLVGPNTTVRLAYTKGGRPVAEMVDEAYIWEKYGLKPAQLIDLKALMGDSSDNVPGVPGVGEKTALALMQEVGSLEKIYEDIDALTSVKAGAKNKLREGRESAFLSRQLVTIHCGAPIDTNLASYQIQPPDQQKSWELMSRLELFSLVDKFGIQRGTAQVVEQKRQEPVHISFNTLPEDLFQRKEPVDILFDIYQNQIIAFCLITKEALYLWDKDAQETAAKILASNLPKRTNRLKELYHVGLTAGFEVKGIVFDAEIAGYILDPQSNDYSISRLAALYGTPAVELASFFGTSGPLLEECALYTALADLLEEKISQNGQYKLLHEVELPLCRVLAEMEHVGIGIDVEGLTAYGEKLDAEIEKYSSSVFAQAGQTFNLNSPKQLGEILFEKLGLPTGKKTKTGYSTSADVLENLRGKHPIIEDILEYRKVQKLKSTYVDGLLKVVGSDGRIHTSFQQTLTRTGRISSTEPNMQNIPIRTQLGSELRRFFVARPGTLLLDADYSQIELRVLAHIAGDKNMIEAFQNDEDIHTRTASQVFNLPPPLITSGMRSRAKAVNFGIVYGIGAYSLSQDIGVSVGEAKAYIDGYLKHFSGVKEYMDATVEFATEHGYVQTLMGRRRYLPELSSSNRAMREFGKRVALNTPIQGAAADIIKVAMVRVFHRLKQEGLEARLLLQVHDELIVECPQHEVATASKILREEMEGAAQLSVPLRADVGTGPNWLEAK
ncbi:MAG: DNA polymerase I [Oscillospiraceae bacterium]